MHSPHMHSPHMHSPTRLSKRQAAPPQTRRRRGSEVAARSQHLVREARREAGRREDHGSSCVVSQNAHSPAAKKVGSTTELPENRIPAKANVTNGPSSFIVRFRGGASSFRRRRWQQPAGQPLPDRCRRHPDRLPARLVQPCGSTIAHWAAGTGLPPFARHVVCGLFADEVGVTSQCSCGCSRGEARVS